MSLGATLNQPILLRKFPISPFLLKEKASIWAIEMEVIIIGITMIAIITKLREIAFSHPTLNTKSFQSHLEWL